MPGRPAGDRALGGAALGAERSRLDNAVEHGAHQPPPTAEFEQPSATAEFENAVIEASVGPRQAGAPASPPCRRPRPPEEWRPRPTVDEGAVFPQPLMVVMVPDQAAEVPPGPTALMVTGLALPGLRWLTGMRSTAERATVNGAPSPIVTW